MRNFILGIDQLISQKDKRLENNFEPFSNFVWKLRTIKHVLLTYRQLKDAEGSRWGVDDNAARESGRLTNWTETINFSARLHLHF